MLPTPEISVWSSSRRLMPAVRAPDAATNASSSNSGSNGSRAMWAISGGSSAPPSETDSPPNIRWSTKRSSPAPVGRRAARAGRSGPAGGARRGAGRLHQRAGRSCRGGRGARRRCRAGSQRYLPRRRAASNRRPVSAAAKPAGPREVTAYGTRVEDLTRLDRAADDVALEAVADDLDLGQLGHRSVGQGQRRRRRRASPRARRTPSPRRPARPPSWSGRRRCRSGCRRRAPAR